MIEKEGTQSEPMQAQLQHLIAEEVRNLLEQDNMHQSSTQEDEEDCNVPHNIYFDKQLTHLVLSEEFDFEQISKILCSIFRHDNLDTSQDACRIRWAYLHRNRQNMIQKKQKVKEGKRARSVAAFSNPYSLYSVDELIQNLQANQLKQKKGEIMKEVFEGTVKEEGYNIFRDNFRKIKDMDEYMKKQFEMKEALERAKTQTYEEKPLYFSPKYEIPGDFQVVSEQFTVDKMRKLMAYQIQMQKINREMAHIDPTQTQKYQNFVKRKVENQRKNALNQGADFEQNWDQYESD